MEAILPARFLGRQYVSHVAEYQFSVPRERLLALKRAIEKFCPELEFKVGQNNYRTWKTDHGRLVGDWKLPPWLKESAVGHNADHVIRMKDEALKGRQRDAHGAPYEIGVVPVQVERDENGKEVSCQYDPDGNEFKLVCDFYNQGNGLLNCKGVGRSKTDYAKGKAEVDAFDQLKMFYQAALDEIVAEENGDQIGELMSDEEAKQHGIDIPAGCFTRINTTEARVGIA
mgnify:CR=1 FL=1